MSIDGQSRSAKHMGWAIVAALALVFAICYGCFDDGTEKGETRLNPPVSSTSGVASSRAMSLSIVPSLANASQTTSQQPQSSEIEYLVHRSKLSNSWLLAHGFLLDSSLHNLIALLDGRTELNAVPLHILTIAPAEAMQNIGIEASRIAPQERYVHASLEAGFDRAEDSVIVRWRRLDDQNVIELSSQAIPENPNDALQLWMYRTQDWSPGLYRLEVISASPNLQLLASADFEITKYGAPVTAFEFPINATVRY